MKDDFGFQFARSMHALTKTLGKPLPHIEELMEDEGGAKNTDVEIWRKILGDYYSPSIHVTEQGNIGINVGGYVLVAPVERWFAAGEAANRRGCLMEDEHIVRMPPLNSYPVRVRIKSVTKGTPRFVGLGICEWDELSNEALEEFERLIDESAPPEIAWCRHRHWTDDDWRDWLMGK